MGGGGVVMAARGTERWSLKVLNLDALHYGESQWKERSHCGPFKTRIPRARPHLWS